MRSILCALVLFLSVGSALAETAVVYPMGVVTEETEQAGIFRNRQPRRQQAPPAQPGQPAPEDGNRTAPVDPNALPKFDGAPADGGGTLNLAELTPEQKQQLIQAIIAIVSALLGAFAGSGKAGPFLSALLAAFKGIAQPVPPAPTPAKTRKRAPKAKAKPKAAAPKS